ncbi:hypothetical protein AB0H12_30055 [Actinosynnema sp. NPDC023794]
MAHLSGLVTAAGLSVRARLDFARASRGRFDTERPEASRVGGAAVAVGSVVHRFRHGLPGATPHALAPRGEFASRLGGVMDRAGDWMTLTSCGEAAVRAGRRAAARVHAASPRTGTRRQPA